MRFTLRAAFLGSSLALTVASTPTAAAERQVVEALTGDFVEIGPVTSGVSRSQALVTLVNDSGRRLDVTLGVGSSRMEAGDRLLVRCDAGDVDVRAAVVGDPAERLEGTLRVERALRFEVVFGFGPVRIASDDEGAAPPAAPGAIAQPPAPSAPASGASAQPAAPTTGKHEIRRKRNGRVDVGRKRPRDRERAAEP